MARVRKSVRTTLFVSLSLGTIFAVSRFCLRRQVATPVAPCLRKAADVLCIVSESSSAAQAYEHCRENVFARSTWVRDDQNISDEVKRARSLIAKSNLVSVGSSLDSLNGFCSQVVKDFTVCTDRRELDLCDFASWMQLFEDTGNPPKVLFAEHVLEHFSPLQVHYIAAAAYISLKPGGVFRVAVPDGYKPSPSYQQYIRAGSTPSGFGDVHIVAYTFDSLVPIFESVGFVVKPREFYDKAGNFLFGNDTYDFDRQYGSISRSLRHDVRNAPGFKLPWSSKMGTLEPDVRDGEAVYTSLWFDAYKPVSCPSIF